MSKYCVYIMMLEFIGQTNTSIPPTHLYSNENESLEINKEYSESVYMFTGQISWWNIIICSAGNIWRNKELHALKIY